MIDIGTHKDILPHEYRLEQAAHQRMWIQWEGSEQT